jgi:hypothetical protein
MPQFLLAAAVGAVAYTAFRVIRREMDRVAGRLAEVRVTGDPDAPKSLVRGSDGVYRPEH